MLCGFTVQAESGAETYQSGNFVYSVNEDGNAVITGYTGSDADLMIPEYIDDYRVEVIGDYAFEESDNLTLKVTKGLYASQWAEANNINYEYAEE